MEYISYQGQHTFLALTEKFTTGTPHYIEFAHKQPAIVDSIVLKKIQTIIPKALDSLKIEYGASHSEIKIDKSGNIKIIEIGSRMGGDCIGSDLVPLSAGYDFMRMVIDIAVGHKPDFTCTKHYSTAFIRFIFTKNDIETIKKIKNNAKCIVIREAILLSEFQSNITDSSSRYGYCIFASDDNDTYLEL